MLWKLSIILPLLLALEQSSYPLNGPSHPPCDPDCDNLEDVRCCKPRNGKKSKNTRCPLECLPDNPAALTNYKVIEPDQGFYTFDFGYGNRGGVAYTNFIVNNPITEKFRIAFFDCFCAGDKFLVIDSTNSNTYAANSSQIFDLDCSVYEENPIQCFSNPDAWSNTDWIILTPGYHNFTIQTAVSPWGQGTGFAILQQIFPVNTPVCEDPESSLFPCNLSINADEACCAAKPLKYPVPEKEPPITPFVGF